MSEKSLEELYDRIRREKPFVGQKPYSHNIISVTLASIAEKFGKDEANRAIRTLRLKRLGWEEE